MQTTTNELRYKTAYAQGKRDAIQGKPCAKPFGDTARAGYSDGYHDGLIESLAQLTEQP
jgi:hypothetical protein